MTKDENGEVLGQREERPRHGGVGRLPARADAGSDDDRAVAHQGADRDHRAARRHPLHRLLLRIRGGEPRLARQSEAGISLFDHRAVHPVRIVGAWPDHPPHAAGPRPAGGPALYRRADRDLDADDRAGAAHQQHGVGGRARLRRADDLFHLHHPLDAAAGFLALHLHRRGRRRSIVLHGDVLPSRCRRQCRAALLSRRAQPDRADLRRAGRRGRASSCGGSSRPASRRRPRATASPICSASTSRRRWSNA